LAKKQNKSAPSAAKAGSQQRPGNYGNWIETDSSMKEQQTMACSSTGELFIIHPITARRVPRKRKRQCTGCKQLKSTLYFFLPFPPINNIVNFIRIKENNNHR
jgi:hypothetical protein